MASPSSAKIPVGSSTKLVHGSKRDATGRSRIIGASSVSNSSRRVNGSVANVNGGASGHGSGHSTRVFLDGMDVTPQSLLVSRIKPSTPSGGSDPRGKKGGRAGRSKGSHGVGASVVGASMMGASMLFSNASSSSADNDSDSESSSSVVGMGSKGPRKEVKSSIGDHTPSSSAPPSSNQEDDENARAASTAPADNEEQEDGKDDAVDPLVSASGLAVEDGSLLAGRKSLTVATGVSSGRVQRVPITVMLAETTTEMLFELRSVCVAQDAPNHAAVTARNKRYQATCAQKKGSDKYVEGRTQTLQLAQKAKEVMTAPPATRDAACVATDWDIYDCDKLEDESNAEVEEVGVGGPASAGAPTPTPGTSTEGQSKDSADGASATPAASGVQAEGGGGIGTGDVQLKQQVDEIVGATLVSPGCVLDVDGDIVEDLRAKQHHASKPSRKARDKHGQSNAYSQKSRMFDSQRSTAVAAANGSGNSNASVALGEQSGGNVAAGASQDFAGLTGGDGASSGSAATNSQVGMSVANASRGVLSGGGPAGGSGDAKANNVYARANTNVDIGEIIARQRTSHVLGSSSLLLMANIVERAVQQNVYHQRHVRYRDFPTLETSPVVPEAPSLVVPALGMGFPTTVGAGSAEPSASTSKTMSELEELWAFRCELTQDRTVSCLAWNTVNEDLLAVSYAPASPPNQAESTGSPSPVAPSPSASNAASSPAPRAGQNATASTGAGTTGTGNDGLVLFWSLTNPEFPERIYHLPVGVTSIDFSTAHPYLLAVGFADGVVSIYDTRKDDSTPAGQASASATAPPLGAKEASSAKHVPVPIATSSGMSGKHLDAVWQVRWVARGGGESVVSVSADGRVVEWSLKKGLSYSDLMTLKRAPNPLLGGVGTAATGTNGVGGGSDGVISRQASGRSLAFANQGDPAVYFVGTEDGLVHKCSVSYNEQYLQTYVGHTGPVYQLIVSPFCSDLFLSCSGDWSLKLWHQADPRGDAVLTFHSVDLAQAVLGASWSPSDAAVFAAVAEDGRIELWDLAQSTLDPVVRHFPKRYVSVTTAVPPTTDPDALNSSSRDMTPKGEPDKDADTYRAPSGPTTTTTMVEVPLECTTVAFAPKAPVLVVGDSTGDVTVYRVPAQVSNSAADIDTSSDVASFVEEQAARLLRAIRPNKHE